MKIYIDEDYKCSLHHDIEKREIETEVFNGKCKTYIEGFRFIPKGEMWIREDGTEFHGEMIAPWKPYELLAMAQEAYDEANEITKIITGEVAANDES